MLESDIAERDEKFRHLSVTESVLEQKEKELLESLAGHLEQERVDIRDSAKKNTSVRRSQENLFSELSNSRSRSKFLTYQYQNNLEPVSEVNESRGSINPFQRDSQMDNELSDSITMILRRLDELVVMQQETQFQNGNNNPHKLSLKSLGIHSQFNSIPTSTYGTNIRDHDALDNYTKGSETKDQNSSAFKDEEEDYTMQRKRHVRTGSIQLSRAAPILNDNRHIRTESSQFVRQSSDDPEFDQEHKEQNLDLKLLGLTLEVAEEMKEFKKYVKSKVDDVSRIAKDLKSVRKEISKLTLNSLVDINSDPELLSTKICEMILPKIVSILTPTAHIQLNEDTLSKRTFLVHSEASPRTQQNDENYNQFNFQVDAHTNFNTRSQGNLTNFRQSKQKVVQTDIMQYIFKISSLFTNLLADLIVDMPYYEDSRQEIIT